MQPCFHLAVDRRRRLLTFMASGFFDLASIERVAGEKAAASHALGGDLHDHSSIVDVCDCKIQAQEVAEGFARVIRDPRYLARRVAFVVGPSSLARMQVRRTTQELATVRMFDSVAEAEAWLFAGEACEAA